MINRILEECSTRGTCLLNRKQFEEAFTGHDLTIQVRAAIDFAQQNGLAFGRSTGDQQFVFSRLSVGDSHSPGEGNRSNQRQPQRNGSARKNRRSGGGRQSSRSQKSGSQNRPFGRSF